MTAAEGLIAAVAAGCDAPQRQFGVLRAHQARHPSLRHHQIHQRQRREHPVRILRQPSVAHLGKAELPLEHVEHMLHPRPRTVLGDQVRAALVAAVAVDPRLVPVQQVCYRVLNTTT